MFENKGFYWLSLIFVIIGAINWGMVGLFNVNLIQVFLGSGLLSRLIFIIVGLSGVFLIVNLIKMGKIKQAKDDIADSAKEEIGAIKKKIKERNEETTADKHPQQDEDKSTENSTNESDHRKHPRSSSDKVNEVDKKDKARDSDDASHQSKFKADDHDESDDQNTKK